MTTATKTFLISMMAAASAALTLGACTSVECAPGTLQSDNVCVPSDNATPSSATCGAGTVFDPLTQECAPIGSPTECGPNTTAEVQPNGTIQCVGTGGASCDAPLPCPAPSGGKVSVCGQLFDTETAQPVRAPDATGVQCDADSPTTDGPCALSVALLDPLAFAADPTGTPPLGADEIAIDDCGRFRAVNVVRPFNGFLAVATEDHPGAASPSVELTGIAFPALANEQRTGVRAFVTRETTDAAWTAGAGDPFGGQSFVERGVYVPVFMHDGQPVEGVTITAGGAVHPDDDFYFGDTDPSRRASVDIQADATGLNGAGLLVGSSLIQHSGAGGEPDGCEWPSDLAASIAGAVFFREVRAHAAGDSSQPCEAP